MSEAKFDSGKPKLTLVPRQIIFDIAKIREYGVQKYKDPDNWKKVEIERYRDAAFRHFMAYLNDPYGVDDESGLPHLAHLACNIAFLCEMQKDLYDTPIEKDSDSKNYKVNVIKDYDDLLHFIQTITNEGCVVDKIENTPSGEIDKDGDVEMAYTILYHKP